MLYSKILFEANELSFEQFSQQKHQERKFKMQKQGNYINFSQFLNNLASHQLPHSQDQILHQANRKLRRFYEY